jgi:hypothetical protein
MTEERRQVHVSGGKGVVVGDYATVFQSFTQSPPSIASCIRTEQFRALVDERTRNFIGREFVFAEIRRVLAGEEFASGYAVIRGEPGIGKTSLAVSLVVRHGYVHHFNVAAENIRSPAQFLQNVCAQLIVRYGLGHAALPPQAGQDAGFLSQVLTESAGAARDRGDLPVVVVVDGPPCGAVAGCHPRRGTGGRARHAVARGTAADAGRPAASPAGRVRSPRRAGGARRAARGERRP